MSEERPILGIDLGTSNTCLAFVDGDQVRVVTDERGRGVTPSVVCLDAQGEFVVGHFAKAQRITNPYQTVYSTKRLLGWDWNAPMLQQAVADLSYRVEEDGNNLPICVLGERRLRPYELSAVILMHVKRLAETYLGQEVREAVITVPAHFNDRQRKETMMAAQRAGLEVLRLINEPTAAALAYGYGYDAAATIAIYDFGGGTFDISILEIDANVFEVLATGGDSYLGGDDLNRRIAEYVMQAFQQESGIDLTEDQLAVQRVIDAAEKAKIALSAQPETVVNLPRIAPSIDFNAHLYNRLTRDQVNDLCRDLVQRTLDICTQTFKDARINPREITDVVLVGGSTRMPLVKEMVSEFFGMHANDSLHPDHVVAVGAAIQSHALVDNQSDILLVDVTPLSLGIESLGGRFSAVIPKNTKVPHRVSRVFTTTRDYQEEVRIKIFQGEGDYTEENHALGEFVLGGIRKALKREPRIDVTFRMDANGVLQVTAMDLDTGKAQSVEIKNALHEDMETEFSTKTTQGFPSSDLPPMAAAGPGGSAGVEPIGPPRNHDSNARIVIGRSESGQIHGSGPIIAEPVGTVGVGTRLASRYELVQQIGAGAFGAVYKATDHNTGVEVAVKLLMAGATLSDAAAVDRFKREAQVLQSLNHPNLVNVYDFGQTQDGVFFMVLEFIRGEDLQDILKRENRFDPTRASQVMRQALLALREAHNKRIVHRDLKPGNIMITRTPDGQDYVKVLDFGVAKLMDDPTEEKMEDLTVAGKVLGTPRYIAPEQLAGGGNQPYSDIYSMGLIYYRMVTGQRAIRGETIAEILGAQVSPNPVIPDGDPLVPPPLFPVLRKATEKVWRTRFQNADEFIAALDEVDYKELSRYKVPGATPPAPMVVRSAPVQPGQVQRPRQRGQAQGGAGIMKRIFKK